MSEQLNELEGGEYYKSFTEVFRGKEVTTNFRTKEDYEKFLAVRKHLYEIANRLWPGEYDENM
jgi:hypothetical protein